ncbi:MAG: host-nuclease inhibitor Gam family protein [candidate division WOR-3 bacterium]|nr:host-nuclease inhibitor Gam family protein [candidate division WOR-3 bacterium]
MPKRIKPNKVYPVSSLEECDQALARIAYLQRTLQKADAELNDKIDRLKAETALQTAQFRQELEQLINGVEAFGETHKAELFSKEKTRELPHGFIGFRSSTYISITQKTLSLLKKLGFSFCIRIKESVDKEKLAKLSDDQLAQVSAKRVTQDHFWFEVKDEEVARKIL